MIEEATVLRLVQTIPLAIARMLAVFATLPFLNRQILSGFVKNSIVIALILPMLAVVPVHFELNREKAVLIFIAIMIKEAFIGFIIGLLIGIVFWAAQNAGDFIDLQRGAFYALMFDPMVTTNATPFGNLFFHILVTLFFINGGFTDLIKTIYDSYSIWPIDEFLPIWNIDLATLLAQTFLRLGRLTVAVSAPVILACFSVDLSMGLINRVAPNQNVFMLSLPIKSALAVLIVAVYCYFFIPFLRGNLLEPKQILQIIRTIFQ